MIVSFCHALCVTHTGRSQSVTRFKFTCHHETRMLSYSLEQANVEPCPCCHPCLAALPTHAPAVLPAVITILSPYQSLAWGGYLVNGDDTVQVRSLPLFKALSQCYVAGTKPHYDNEDRRGGRSGQGA